MKPGERDSRETVTGRPGATLRIPLLLVTGIAALAGIVGSASAAEIATPIHANNRYFASPGGNPIGNIPGETRSGRHAGLLVIDRQEVNGQSWIAVRVGQRPNDRVGWLRESRVGVRKGRAKIVVSVDQRRMTFFLDGRARWSTDVVVGKPSTPTPRGLFALHDIYRVGDELRPWILETTAHSEALRTFEGGPARVAIHGRHGALAVAPWGTAMSNGCIRTPDWALKSLVRWAAIGTPIEVR